MSQWDYLSLTYKWKKVNQAEISLSYKKIKEIILFLKSKVPKIRDWNCFIWSDSKNKDILVIWCTCVWWLNHNITFSKFESEIFLTIRLSEALVSDEILLDKRTIKELIIFLI